MIKELALPTCLGAVALIAVACGGTGSDPDDGAADPPPAAMAADDTTPEPGAVTPADGALTLDYTAFIPGAVQPSGIGVNPDATMAALVTDFERVVVVDIAAQEPTAEFGVGRNELPRQGATEAVAFLDDGRVAVLYPDDAVIGIFDLDGTPLDELDLDVDADLDGAMTVTSGNLVVISRDDSGAALRLVDPETGSAMTIPLVDDVEPLEGLSPAEDADALLGVTADGGIHRIDARDGTASLVGRVAEVDDPSGVEVFRNEAEGEVQIGVTDDADAYNSEPSPLRLYLA